MPKPKKERKPTITQDEREKITHFFNENGLTFTAWAKERGFNPIDCFNVVYSNKKCIRGKAFQVATQLKAFCLQ